MFCVFEQYLPKFHTYTKNKKLDIILNGFDRDSNESVPRREEGSTGKYEHEVEGVPEGAARGNSQDQMPVFSCTPRLESRYRYYPIYKSDEP